MAAASFAAALRRGLVAGGRFALSAVLWCVLLVLLGAGAIVAGVYLLGGLGWALLTAGAMALVVAALLLLGVNRAA